MKIAVVGLGYVGIPIAVSFANANHSVAGIDIDPDKVDFINEGKNPLPTREPELDTLLSHVLSKGSLKATESIHECRDADAIIICVDTPVDPSSKTPNYEALKGVLETVAGNMRQGVLVCIESTLAPGTMRNMVVPILEGGSGLKVHEEFHLVHCPERVTSGRLLENLANLDRVVGGDDNRSRQLAVELYDDVCSGTLHETDWITAELSKTAENAYRDVQLAFANEVAMICGEVGADVFKVRELVNTCPGRSMLLPGPGVGGHCIPKDSWLLASSFEDGVRLIPAAREVNEGMLDYVASLIGQALQSQGIGLGGSTVVLLGGAYKENVAEVINSPGLKLYKILEALDAHIRLHDPHIPELEGFDLYRDLMDASEGADCLVLVTAHDVYRDLDLKSLGKRMSHRLLVDCRGAVTEEEWRKADFHYVGLGKPSNL